MRRPVCRAAALTLVMLASCGPPADPGPSLQVLGESTRWRIGDPVPRASPWFDGAKVTLVAARGETLGIQVLHPEGSAVTVTVSAAAVKQFSVAAVTVTRPSTALYGGSRGAGRYPDVLTESAAPTTNPAYVEITLPRDTAPGLLRGTLTVGTQAFPIELTVAPVTLAERAPAIWAYADPRELAPTPADGTPSSAERSCAALFRAHGVLLAPDLPLAWFAARRSSFAGMQDLPVVIPDDPRTVGDAVRAWIDATRGTGLVPFAIPIDEPRTPARRAEVVALARAVRDAGGGPTTFRFALTDSPRPEYADLIDQYIELAPTRGHDAWAYNGAPPRAGAMVADALTPGARTWGWIAWRYRISTWYVWDALYWHDRHNRRGQPRPGRALDVTRDAVSFDDGEDHGNLDGVLALPAPEGAQTGCMPTLRLAAVRRGQQDRALLELASTCDLAATEAIAARLVPRALGDAPATGTPSWPTDEAAWELARRELLRVASCGKTR